MNADIAIFLFYCKLFTDYCRVLLLLSVYAYAIFGGKEIGTFLKLVVELCKLIEEEVEMMLKVAYFPLGPVQTNCYFIQDAARNCLIIDPGEEGEKIIQYIEKEQLKPVAILLTHGHFDHIGAVDAVRDAFNISVYIHELEQHTLTDPEENGSTRYPGLPRVENRPADHLIGEAGMMEIGPFTFEMRYTPGHSPGSLSFVFKEAGFAIVGDTLFQGSIGRTDLPGGDMKTLLTSIGEQLLTLPDDTRIYPGHGGPTTPGEERVRNPFLV